MVKIYKKTKTTLIIMLQRLKNQIKIPQKIDR